MIINFAHRGSLTEAPENTIAAMKKALNHNAKAIELDVQMTKDHQLVVIHDHTFTRFNKLIKGCINDYTLEEIKAFDVGSTFSKEYSEERVPTLEEVLQVVPKEVLLNIEIKNLPIIYNGIEEAIVETLKRLDRLNNVIVSSFDHIALQKVHKLHNNIPLGLLLSQRLIEPWVYADHLNLPLASVHPLFTTVSQDFVDQFHRRGLKVYPYTVNEIDYYEHLINQGVDGVFSNNPNIFKI